MSFHKNTSFLIGCICYVVIGLVFSLNATGQSNQANGGNQTNAAEPTAQTPTAATRVAPVEPAERSQADADSQKPTASDDPEMSIRNGDLLEISVYGAPEFTRMVRVGSSGTVTLPMVGEAKVGDLSIGQAEKLIATKLSEGGYFNNPLVSIFERESSTQGVSVLGEVQKPGVYPLPGKRTLFDAISTAGGTTPRAGQVASISHRDSSGTPEKVALSYSGDRLAEGNVPIRPGDTIVVSRAGIIYVVGDVKVPGGFILDTADFTVLKAIAMAQGTNPNAALDKAMLIRKTPEGHTQVPVPLKQILQTKAPDVRLQSGDVLFVPNSLGKSAARRSLEAIVQTATGMAIYRP